VDTLIILPFHVLCILLTYYIFCTFYILSFMYFLRFNHILQFYTLRSMYICKSFVFYNLRFIIFIYIKNVMEE